MKRLLLLSAIALPLLAQAQQRTCGTDIKRQELFAAHPERETQYNVMKAAVQDAVQNQTESQNSTNQTNEVVTVQVVFHVLYKNDEQNVSDEQIFSQLQVLNDDYRKLNADFSTVVPPVFQPFGADLEIQFVMATTDPSGNPTTGITRKSVSNAFNFYSAYYLPSGRPAWNTSEYLNIWVGDLSAQGLLGFAYGPEASGLPNDGLCIGYYCFGVGGSADAPYDQGRTATHEIGHYFGLDHPWGPGNGGCGSSDGVADTPTTSGPYYGCPNFPAFTYACGTSPNGSMFMNFMDYTNDACMAFFTNDQKTIVQFHLNTDRAGVLGVSDHQANAAISFYPNPAKEFVTISSGNVTVDRAELFDLGGRHLKSVTPEAGTIGISELATGQYLVRLYSGSKFLKSAKIVKQ